MICAMSQGETLFRTNVPDRSKSEFYELVVFPRPNDGFGMHGFRETHAWWDEKSEDMRCEITTINPDEAMTFDAAQKMYFDTRRSRAKSGFVHSFTRDHSGSTKCQLISTDEDSN